MQQRYKWIAVALSAVCFLFIFSACLGKSPLDIQTVQQTFSDYYEDIHTVTQFLADLEYRNAYIRDDGENMQADLVDVPIGDAEVSAAAKRLLEAYVSISKIGNTIHLLQWSGADVGCGIAYSINGTDAPEIQCMTELTPLAEDGWFYYVSDYNAWRSNHKTENGSLP
jgi:hypothetical protein